jgi:hypothetical protein
MSWLRNLTSGLKIDDVPDAGVQLRDNFPKIPSKRPAKSAVFIKRES